MVVSRGSWWGLVACAAVFACLMCAPLARANDYVSQFGSSGSGNGHFSHPTSVGDDPSSGDVYVADSANNRVEKFDSSGNYLSQFGSYGSGNGQFSDPVSVAVDPSSGDIYVTDSGNNRVEKFDSSGNYLAQFGIPSPFAVGVDPTSGDVYAVDNQDNRVEKFDSSGTYLMAFGSAGNGNGQFIDPAGIAVDPSSGDVYLTDTGNSRVEKFDSSGNYLSQFGSYGSGNGQFTDPAGVAVDSSSGDVYVSDFGNNRVETFDGSGNYLAQFGTSGTGNGQFNENYGLAVDPSSGDVYVADYDNNRVEKFDNSDTYLNQVGTSGTGNAQFNAPEAVAVDPSSGDFYVADTSNNRVEKFDSSGNYLSQFGAGGSGNGQFSEPAGVAVDPVSGDVYVADYLNDRVEKFDSSGNYLSQFGSYGTGNGQFTSPDGVAVDPSSGDVYVSDVYNDRIEKFTSSGTYLSQFGSGQVLYPEGLAVAPGSGELYVADYGNNRLDKFDSSGNYLGSVGTSGSGSGQFSGVLGVAVNPSSGDVYATDGANDRVEKFDSSGNYLSQLGTSGSGNGQFKYPWGVAVDPSSGDVYVSDDVADRVEKFGSSAAPACGSLNASTAYGTAASVQLSCTAPSGFSPVYQIESGPSHGTVVLDPYSGAMSYTPNPGFSAGTDSFTYHGSVEGARSPGRTVTISVGPAQPPACEDSFLTTAEGETSTAGLSCVDQTGAALSYSIVSGPAHGTLGLLHQSTGQVAYTPAAGYSGADSFTYQATSANGTSNISTVHITINAPPTCDAVSASTSGGAAVTVPLNCSDATGANVTYSIVSGPSNGTLSSIRQATGEVTYTPDSGYTGADSFTYHATSANGTSNTATVTITQAPSCQDAWVGASEDASSVPITVSCSDSTGAPLSYAIDSRPADGTVAVASNGGSQFSYVPNHGFSGHDSFTFHATSSNGSSTVERVGIIVRPVVSLITPAGSAQTNNTTPTFSGKASTGESDGTSVTVSVVAGRTLQGTLVQTLHADVAPSGAWSVTPTTPLPANATYTAQAKQSGGDGTSAVSFAHVFTIDTVAPVVTLTSPSTCSSSTDATPTFSGSAGQAAGDGTTVTVQVFAGIGTAGALVQTLHAAAAHTWSVLASNALPGGTYTAQATQSDQAGNVGTSAPVTFNIATTTVSVSAPAQCAWTNHAQPTFTGAASNAGGDPPTVTVKIFSGWTTTGTPLQTLTSTESAGSWSIPATSALPDGTYTAQASQTIGGATQTSPANRFTVDTVAPAVTLTSPANKSTTSNTTPTLSGAAGTANGDGARITVKIFAGTTASGTPVQTLSATASSGGWSVTPSSALAPGTYTAQASQRDLAGNVGLSSPDTFTIS